MTDRISPAPLVARKHALALVASAPFVAALASCGGGSHGVAVGSKDFTESLLIGEMYAQLLEHAKLSVARKLDLGGTQVAMAALQRGDIDLYPEYTGTALINELKLPPSSDAQQVYQTVKTAYQQKFKLTWLEPAPMNDTQALATTQAVAAKYHLRTLSDLAAAAPQLRLGAIPEFTKRADGLPGLQKRYGGFHFKSIKLFDIGLRYKALETGAVDVVVAFGTDGQIAADHLVVLIDDKHLFPIYQVAPVVRDDTLTKYPIIVPTLNGLAPLLTDDVMRSLNYQVDGKKRSTADVAREFLSAHKLA